MSEMQEGLSNKPKVLVVDDERLNLNALHGLLRDDYQIMAAISGEQGLKAALSGKPDLILLDITMPDMDGLEVCRRLKADPLTREIPVIFITGLTQEEDEVKGFGVGAVDYIPKPFNPVIVKARVKTHAQLKLQSDFLKALAYRDGLTGVANRRRFQDWALEELQRCARLDAAVVVFMIDIDHFKLYNDHYGHQQGDQCLKTVAQCLHEQAVEAGTGMIARYGGEEFVGLFRVTDASAALELGQKMVSRVQLAALPHHKSLTNPNVSISLGGCMATPPFNAALEDVLAQADAQLYDSKTSGRNQAKVATFEAGGVR
jgi:diguanylate cyclase (GGDEF)-like protein